MSDSVTVRLYPEAVGRLCPYCRRVMSGESRNLVPSLDHILSRHRGGTDEPSNLQIICSRCNIVKATLSDEQFKFVRDALGSRFDEICEEWWINGAARTSERRRKKPERNAPSPARAEEEGP